MSSEKNDTHYRLEVPDIAALPSVSFAERKQLPPIGAVYFVCASTTAVLYVGSSKNLQQRWLSHHRDHQCASTPGVRIAWYAVDSVAHRLAIEQHCVAVLRPLYQQAPAPLRRNKKGHEIHEIVLKIPAPLFRHIEQAALDELRSVPNQILWVFERLIRSGQLSKWTGDTKTSSHKGHHKLWTRKSSQQIKLF
jgi:hypothetical protein